jgi:hypothetical protein
VKDNDVIHPIQELGPEVLPQFAPNAVIEFALLREQSTDRVPRNPG